MSDWRRGLRLYWYRANKHVLALVVVFIVVLSGFGLLLNAVFAERAERDQLTCLALNVYFEARGEPKAGQFAVAEVTMNRVASPYYPDSVCDVVYQKNWDARRQRYVGAFSWTELKALPEPKGEEWRRAWEVAAEVYYGRQPPRLTTALHYHAARIRPSWAEERARVAKIGNHVFYR
ncbi:MAG: cell wall hydrolase [Sulfurifustis sp.]